MDLLGLYPRLEWLGHKPHVCLAWIILVSGYTILQTFNMASHFKSLNSWLDVFNRRRHLNSRSSSPSPVPFTFTKFQTLHTKCLPLTNTWLFFPYTSQMHGQLSCSWAILPRRYFCLKGSLETPRIILIVGFSGSIKLNPQERTGERREDVSERTVQTLSSPQDCCSEQSHSWWSTTGEQESSLLIMWTSEQTPCNVCTCVCVFD